MDFFHRQDAARRKTGILIVYFFAAILLITIAVNVVVYLALGAGGFLGTGLDVVTHAPVSQWLSGPHWVWTTVVTLGIIGVGSLMSYLRLAGGGRSVARMVDARLVDLNTTDVRERRLINVVEEMSIASGTSVPEIYIQDGELGINAFVAGYQIREAVLVVTEGALATLTRDELQGVVGHEFSHILNGDMRINVRLIAVLAGVLLLSQLGGYMMRSMRSRRYGRMRSRSSGGNVAAIAGIGIVMFLLGYVGLFFGRLIKAAISREREFLADAASVQFTRNPDGIAGALYKIKHHTGGSILHHVHAEDMSHMCFGETMRYTFSSLFATHPPIEKRIDAINPGFVPAEEAFQVERDVQKNEKENTSPSPATVMDAVVTAQVLLDSVGNPSARHIAYAIDMHADISQTLLEKIHQPNTARAVIYALVLADTNSTEQDNVRRLIESKDGEDTALTMSALLEEIKHLGARSRLPLVELSFPALGRLHRDQKEHFVTTLEQIVKLDKRFTLFEFALITIIRKHLIGTEDAADLKEFNSFSQVSEQLEILISLFSKLGAASDDDRSALYQRVIATFSLQPGLSVPTRDSAQKLTECLTILDRLSPLLKKPVITACADCVLDDGQVKPNEIELLRATCAALDCPMPPLVPA